MEKQISCNRKFIFIDNPSACSYLFDQWSITGKAWPGLTAGFILSYTVSSHFDNGFPYLSALEEIVHEELNE
jgi:hypothetical protein